MSDVSCSRCRFSDQCDMCALVESTLELDRATRWRDSFARWFVTAAVIAIVTSAALYMAMSFAKAVIK